MSHPLLLDLLAEHPPRGVLEHLEGCARCRTERAMGFAAHTLSPGATFDELSRSVTLAKGPSVPALHELAVGPNGQSALTTDPETGETAVLKRLLPERLADGGEALVLPQVAHPTLARARVLDSRMGLLLRDHVEGQDILGWADTNPTEGAWLDLFAGVAIGLGAMHAANEVHANLTPTNLWVQPSGQPVLVDPLPHGVIGWVHDLRAPELEPEDRGTPASDLWAFGAALRQAGAQAGAVPPWVGELCRRLLDPDPASRLSGAELLRLGLERSQRGVPWRSLGLLGRGGMGEVHLAHDPGLDRTVARKSLRPDRRRHERRFLDEARITARLQHPGIIPVHAWAGSRMAAPAT